MNNKIDQLKTELDNIKNSLIELKDNVSLPDNERRNKAEELKAQAEATKNNIQKEIDALNDKTDEESVKQKENAETLLNSFNEIMSLYNSIGNNGNTGIDEATNLPTTDGEDKNEKGFFGKAREWIGEKWSAIPERGKGVLGGISAFIAGKWTYKKIFGKKNKKEDVEETETKSKRKNKKKKSSWWKKGLATVGIGVAGLLGYKNWDKVKELGGGIWDKIKGWFEKEKPLELDEAISSATSEVRNGKIKENPFRQHFDTGITFNQGSSTIESYGESTKIDVKNKMIEGLNNITFPNYEELVHAANIINFARRNFAGKCQNSEPFDISDGGGGDLVVHLANGEKPEWISASDSSLWTQILGVGGCALGTALGAYVGGIKGAVGLGVTLGIGGTTAGNYLDNDSSMGNTSGTVASGTNLKRFKNCLNEQKDENGNSLWPKKSHQEINPDNYSPIEKELNEIIKEIEGTGGEGTGGRNLKSEQNKENPEVFTISSYGQKVDITLKGCTQTGNEYIDYSKITSIKIGKYRKDDRGNGLEIDFSHDKEGLKEAIRVVNFTNFIRSDTNFAGNGGENYPFVYGKYKVPYALDMDTDGIGGKTVLSHNALTTKFPTIYEDLQKQFCKTDQNKLREQAFNNKNFDGYESYYIRYLHQMRNEFDSQSYRTNGQ